MSSLPTLHTARLVLRPLDDGDASVVQRLAGDRRVADTTLTIPHPYEDGMAEAWIATHEASWIMGRGLIMAVTAEGELTGVIGLSITPELHSGELGYWIGVPYWGRGYCTEAVCSLIDHGFVALGLERIHAHHFTRNPASGRVMQKAGMRLLGMRKAAMRKGDQLEDVAFYEIIRSVWAARRSAR